MTKSSTFFLSIVSLVFASLSNVHATKFYPYGNPCASDPMYYEDAVDVLDDLSSFSSLYIKYEGCAYSLRTDILSDDANSGEANWYLGFNFKQGANAAFSLYGVKKRSYHWRKCSKATFIGSFYSLDGLYSFTNAAGIDLDTYYTYNQYNGRNLGDNNKQNSYGLYCTEKNQIVQAMFKDRSTNPLHYKSTLDDLPSLNRVLHGVSCHQVYNSFKNETEYATNLLTNSDACSLFDGDQCPDRYGKLAACEKKFEAAETAVQKASQKNNSNSARARFLVGSVIYVFAAFLVFDKVKRTKAKAKADSTVYNADEMKRTKAKAKASDKMKRTKAKAKADSTIYSA